MGEVMIIGLNGRMRAGKDTVAQILMANFENVERVAFADKLKDSAAAALRLTREELEDLKLHGRLNIQWSVEREVEGRKKKVKDVREREISGREYLQYYGTEAHREVFGDDFWIEQALDRTQTTEDGILVVTDMRFPNELAAVQERGGVTVKVLRPEADSQPILHASEQILDDSGFDFFLNNDGSLETLTERVLSLAKRIEENYPQFKFGSPPPRKEDGSLV